MSTKLKDLLSQHNSFDFVSYALTMNAEHSGRCGQPLMQLIVDNEDWENIVQNFFVKQRSAGAPIMLEAKTLFSSATGIEVSYCRLNAIPWLTILVFNRSNSLIA